MAELRPYNPTWRDRIAAALIGGARPGSARANFAEGVTGSRGIDTTGMGLVDFTPAGIPMAAQEANRSAMAGDTVGAIANAMAVIPAAKVPARAVKSFEQLVAEAKARLIQRQEQTDALVAIGKPIRMENRYGHTALVQPDMSGSNGWRVTRFDDAGPMGHGEYTDAREAILRALEDGYFPIENKK